MSQIAFLVQIEEHLSTEAKISFPDGGLYRGVPLYYNINLGSYLVSVLIAT